MVNYGTVVGNGNAAVNWIRGASMQNMAGGVVYFNGSQRWGSDELVSMFVPVATLVDVGSVTTGLTQYVGVSLPACARLCAYTNVTSTREIAPGLVIYDTLVCEAFLYNNLIRTCQLSGTLITAASALSPTAVWSLYTKNTAWIASPLLVNMLGGVVKARVGVSASVNLAVLSNGSVSVPAGSSLSFGYQFAQGSHGRLTVQGKLTLAQSTLLGNATGTGTLAFTASNGTVASDSSVLIGNGQHTIDASFAAPALTMLVQGSGALVNFGRHAQVTPLGLPHSYIPSNTWSILQMTPLGLPHSYIPSNTWSILQMTPPGLPHLIYTLYL